MSNELAGDLIAVEVAYATIEKQHLLTLKVPANCTVAQAIERSGICELCPDIDLGSHKLGVWGKLAKAEQILNPRDRVEIYRPLKADPKDARRKRAKQAAA
ncbi:MAG: RnfH family protein [Oceanococcus sp.]